MKITSCKNLYLFSISTTCGDVCKCILKQGSLAREGIKVSIGFHLIKWLQWMCMSIVDVACAGSVCACSVCACSVCL